MQAYNLCDQLLPIRTQNKVNFRISFPQFFILHSFFINRPVSRLFEPTQLMWFVSNWRKQGGPTHWLVCPDAYNSKLPWTKQPYINNICINFDLLYVSTIEWLTNLTSHDLGRRHEIENCALQTNRLQILVIIAISTAFLSRWVINLLIMMVDFFFSCKYFPRSQPVCPVSIFSNVSFDVIK